MIELNHRKTTRSWDTQVEFQELVEGLELVQSSSRTLLSGRI